MQATYTTWMKYIYKMQNLTFGSDGGLTAACKAKHPDAPGLCFMCGPPGPGVVCLAGART